MLRQFAFATVLIAFSSLAVVAAEPNAATHVKQGDAWSKKGDLDKAIKDYTEAINLDPSYAEAYYDRGDAWSDKGDLDKAISDYTEAIRLDPKYALAYYNRGNAWGIKGDLNKAIKDYTEAIKLDPSYAEAYNDRGDAWSKKGDLDKAISDYTEAINLDPSYAEAYNDRGTSWTMKGEFDNAIKDYTEAIRLDPKDSPAYNNLAWILGTCPNAALRSGTKAVEYAKQACELTAWKDAEHLDTLAAAYAEAGDFDKAIKWQEKAIALAASESDKQDMRSHLKLYKAGKPYRDVPKK